MIAKLTLRNLRANAGRFAMTTFGVVLAVSFVVSAFVLGDGLRRTFGDLATDIVVGTDLEVRPVETFASPESLDEADVAAVAAIDGVAHAVGQVEAPENSVRPITAAGEEIPTAGPPQLAFSWSDVPGASPLTLVQGTSPDPGEFLIDIDSADRHDFVVGDSYAVVSATGRHDLTLSGLTSFGADNHTLGATLMSMNAGETDALFGTTGYDSIAVALTDVARADIASAEAAVSAALPGFEVVDQTTLADENAAGFNTQVDLIQSVLLGFAGISLLVSTFIIANTFAIVLAQRTREMGLLRIVGADAAQLRRGALGEAAAVGVLAAAIGIPGGIGVASGITALFGAIGVDLPPFDIIVSTRTIAVASAVGIGVTLVAAWWPTSKASRVPALAALGSGLVDSDHGRAGRTVGAVGLGLVGIASSVGGVAGSASTAATITLMVLGALALLGAVTLISPRLVTPVTAGFATVLERLGMPGRLAVRNARRQAGRTATTGAALMIGLAVVSMALVVGASVKAELADTLDSAVAADYVLTDQASQAGLSTAVVDEIAADPAFGAVSGFRVAEMQIDDEIVEITAARLNELPELLDVSLTAGSLEAGPDSVVVSEDRALRDGLSVGDTVEVLMQSGASVALQVAGLFGDDSVIDQDWLVDVAVFDRAGVAVGEEWIAFNLAPGMDSDDRAAAAIAALETRFPQGELETAAEFRDRMEGLIDQILAVLNALVALAVVIALIGIANTLALSVSERTREIGLMRAVGMGRRGVRRMVRYESAIIAAFGALLGVAMGIGFGWLTVAALPASFADTVAVPVASITALVAVAAIAGLVAAVLPARRAGRMNVLAAIAS